MLNIRSITFLFGVTFILVAVLGFIPNPLVSPHGVFAVNGAHNLVHLLTGVAFIAGAMIYRGQENMVVKVIGVLYMLVATIGFVTTGDRLLGLVHINEADRWLHLGLAVVILGAGFFFKQPALAETLNADW